MPTVQPEELSLVPIQRGKSGGAAVASALRRGQVVPGLVRGPRPASASPSERVHRGPGWFDSSWDLRAGCEVHEGWPLDAGLREWIEAWLFQPARGATRSQSGG